MHSTPHLVSDTFPPSQVGPGGGATIYIFARPPPKIHFFHPFVCPKFYQKAFCTIKKKNKKKQKNKKQQKKKQKRTKTLRKLWLRHFPQGFVFFVLFFFGFVGFSVCSVYGFFGHILEKNTFHYRPLVFTISLRKRLFPKYFRQFILNFFLWRPDFSKGSSLLSLKTGIFQREVASREESSIWTNRLCVKQDFVKRKKGIIWTKLVRWGLSFKKKCYLERKWIIRKNVF